MIDTAGTVVRAAELLDRAGRGDVSIAATHGAAVGPGGRPAEERPDPRGRRHQHAADPEREAASTPSTVLSIAPIVAEALDAVFEDTCVSEIFQGDNV